MEIVVFLRHFVNENKLAFKLLLASTRKLTFYGSAFKSLCTRKLPALLAVSSFLARIARCFSGFCSSFLCKSLEFPGRDVFHCFPVEWPTDLPPTGRKIACSTMCATRRTWVDRFVTVQVDFLLAGRGGVRLRQWLLHKTRDNHKKARNELDSNRRVAIMRRLKNGEKWNVSSHN